jgi:hypothetical protein
MSVRRPDSRDRAKLPRDRGIDPAQLERWLLHPTRQYPEGDTRTKIDVPRSAAAAVKTEAFYTVALGHQGPAVARYVTIPILAPPSAKFATAMLATTDVGPQIPSNPD